MHLHVLRYVTLVQKSNRAIAEYSFIHSFILFSQNTGGTNKTTCKIHVRKSAP